MGDRRAIVIGGGVVGLTAALKLRDEGFEVTVVEQDGSARGASLANAGWVETHTLQPLPSPSTLRFGLASLVKPNAPLYIKPRPNFALLEWLVRFALASTKGRWESGRADLMRLAEGNGEEITRWAEAIGVPITSRESLSVFDDEGSAAASAEALGIADRRGVSIVDASGVRALEPGLSDRAGGGLLLRGEVVLDPAALMQGLRRALDERAILSVATRAIGFRRRESEITHVRTTTGDIGTDVVVIATGFEADALTRSLGTRLAMQPGKGFSVELDLPIQPRRMISLAHAKVGIVPHSGGARLVGTMELSGANDRIDDHRIDGILDAAEPYIREFPQSARLPSARRVVLGHRPLLPTGLPVIDRLPRTENVYVSTGHAMMGVSLAIPSARLLADYIRTGARPAALAPFRLTA